jgi:hypothetical protein
MRAFAILIAAHALAACSYDQHPGDLGDAGRDAGGDARDVGAGRDAADDGFHTYTYDAPHAQTDGSWAWGEAGVASLITTLSVGMVEEGFDFNGDGRADNALEPLGMLANLTLMDAFSNGTLVRAVDFHDLVPTPSGVADDAVVRFAIRTARYPLDADGDGRRAGAPGDKGQPGGDCRDRRDDPLAAAIPAGAGEDGANFVDDDCNGLADETLDPWAAVTDAGCAPPSRAADEGCLRLPSDPAHLVDHDGDGFTVAQGDCDDRDTPVVTINGVTRPIGWFSNPGAPEVCGDGLDNDCNGVADDGCNPFCDPIGTNFDTACYSSYVTAHGDGLDAVAVEALAPDSGTAVCIFEHASTSGGVLRGWAPTCTLRLPALLLSPTGMVDHVLTGAVFRGRISADARGGVSLTDALLGGVLDARALDRIKGVSISDLPIPDINITPEDSLLDAVFVILPKVFPLGLRQVPCHPSCPPGGCLVPDIEMDGDGFECFVDDDPNDGVDRVTLCIDGDGTEVRDGFELDAEGRPKPCTEALKPDGTPRFVDGISLTLKFSAIPTRLGAVEAP